MGTENALRVFCVDSANSSARFVISTGEISLLMIRRRISTADMRSKSTDIAAPMSCKERRRASGSRPAIVERFASGVQNREGANR